MKIKKIYDNGHQWYVLARDPEKPEGIIDTNQYLVVNGKQCLVIDPGGIEIFSAMLSSILKIVDLENISHLFASHQDPDIISSLGLWDQVAPNAELHTPALWEGFIRHFGMSNIKFMGIQDRGGELKLGNLSLKFIPAHYLHSSANFHIYDSKAKILFSGDVGGALESPESNLFVEDFDSHCEKMRFFHQRWMPSQEAKSDWIKRVSELDIEMMLPQHGRIFKEQDTKAFLNWFDTLTVGSAISR